MGLLQLHHGRRINLEGVKVIGEGAFGKTPVSVSNEVILSDPETLIKIGEEYLEGEVAPQIPERGFDLFERASELGSIEAINKLALCYE